MQGREQAFWRRRLRRELAALIALKLVALALLWWLFFSPAHRTVVDADAAGRRLGMVEAAATIESAARTGSAAGAGSAAAAPAPQGARRD
jgi:type II secretory pathway component PulM